MLHKELENLTYLNGNWKLWYEMSLTRTWHADIILPIGPPPDTSMWLRAQIKGGHLASILSKPLESFLEIVHINFRTHGGTSSIYTPSTGAAYEW